MKNYTIFLLGISCLEKTFSKPKWCVALMPWTNWLGAYDQILPRIKLSACGTFATVVNTGDYIYC